MTPDNEAQFIMATADTFRTDGARLLFDGQSEYTEKRFKKLAYATFNAGDRVLVAKINGTYLIIGRILP